MEKYRVTEKSKYANIILCKLSSTHSPCGQKKIDIDVFAYEGVITLRFYIYIYYM